MGIRGYGVQVPRTSTAALLQSIEEQDEGRGLSGEFPSPGKSGSLSHQSRGLEGGLQKHMYTSFVYLIFFTDPHPHFSEARSPPISGLHPPRSPFGRTPPHFRAVRHSLPMPTLPTTYTQGCQLQILGVKPQGGCTKGSVGL